MLHLTASSALQFPGPLAFSLFFRKLFIPSEFLLAVPLPSHHYFLCPSVPDCQFFSLPYVSWLTFSQVEFFPFFFP